MNRCEDQKFDPDKFSLIVGTSEIAFALMNGHRLAAWKAKFVKQSHPSKSTCRISQKSVVFRTSRSMAEH
jgi:hypothetical protein